MLLMKTITVEMKMLVQIMYDLNLELKSYKSQQTPCTSRNLGNPISKRGCNPGDEAAENCWTSLQDYVYVFARSTLLVM